MNYRTGSILGVIVILLQYLGVSTWSSAWLLPEVGIILLVVGNNHFSETQLLNLSLLLGLLADISGASSKGAILTSYVLAVAAILGARRLLGDKMSLPISLALGLFIFHAVNGLFVSPVHLRVWAGTLLIQLIGATILLAVNARFQKAWRPH